MIVWAIATAAALASGACPVNVVGRSTVISNESTWAPPVGRGIADEIEAENLDCVLGHVRQFAPVGFPTYAWRQRLVPDVEG